VIITMGMPAPVFRLVFDAAGLKCLTRGIMRLAGFSVRSTVIGGVEGSAEGRKAWLSRIENLGVRAA